MKIFVAGIATETNTFAASPTTLKDFNVQRGEEALGGMIKYPSLDLSATWGSQARSRGYEFVFSLMAAAQPFGPTTRSAYQELRNEILRDLKATLPVDIVLLNLHGAMIAEGCEDCEKDIIGCVRAIVGEKVVIGVELDPHCNLSEAKIAAADLVVLYKEYPHTDVGDRARELFDLAVDTRLGRIRPTMALFDCRMVGLYPTSRSPMREFVDSMLEIEKRKEVLSVSLGHGFQFADVPELGAKVLVITDNDSALGAEIAERLGLYIYRRRGEIGCESFSLPLEDAFAEALARERWPVVIADQSDNPGGGAPGDATFALRWLLVNRITNAAMAMIYDPEVVRMAKLAGRGTDLTIRLGGKLSHLSGSPVEMTARMTAFLTDYFHALPQAGGGSFLCPAGDIVAVQCAGIDIVVSSERCQCFSPEVFTDLGIDPASKRLLIPKSAQHFYAGFSQIAADIIYMSAPGAVPPDPRQIQYRRAPTQGLYPWTDNPLRA